MYYTGVNKTRKVEKQMKNAIKKLSVLTLTLLLTVSTALPTSAAAAVGKVSSLKSNNIDDDEINLKWKKVTGAYAYQIYVYNSGKWKYAGANKKLNYEVDKLTSAKQYKFKVRAYKLRLGKKVYGPFSTVLSAATEPDEVENVKVKAKSKTAVALTWSKEKGATGYQVYLYSPAKDKYVKKATVKNNSVTISKLKAGTSYKFKVRAYFKVNSDVYYGDFSDVITVKTKASSVSSASSVKSKSEAKLISSSKAVSTALAHAGLKKSQVRDLSWELDKEKGVSVYEVDFDYGKYEFSYEIDSKSGKILHSEKERD